MKCVRILICEGIIIKNNISVSKAKKSLLSKSILKSGLVFSLGITVTGCRGNNEIKNFGVSDDSTVY